jgi:midasin
MSQFTFNQKSTDMATLLQTSVALLKQQRENASTSGCENLQLMLVISDGRMDQREKVEMWVREAQENNILVVIIVLDSSGGKDSIMELQSVAFVNGKVQVSRYMEQFPFWYYVVISEIQSLPSILADSLRQWFELMR